MKASVVGGSMAGLFAALLLKRAGWQVRVYERIGADLSGRGAGIVTHRQLFDVLERAGITRGAAKMGVAVRGRQVLARDGALVGKLPLEQVLTSWGHLHALLRNALGDNSYHHGRTLERVVESDKVVAAHFADGAVAEADLLVGADGIFSTVRAQLLPDVRPNYAGYIAWRGLVDEADLSAATRDALCEHFSFSLPEGEQMLGYPVAGADEAPAVGARRFNFVWYRPATEGTLRDLLTDIDGVSHSLSIPPNRIRAEAIDGLRRDAHRLLAPQFAEVVQKTRQPFIQAILDLETPSMAVGRRTVLIGDAAFVARPHVGAGVTKAAADACALVEALETEADLECALKSFEARRLAVGRSIVDRARHLGAYMQAQIHTPEEKQAAERHRSPQAVMTETASMAFLEGTGSAINTNYPSSQKRRPRCRRCSIRSTCGD
ncbi:FAD binding domain-containing protein [Bradyrhizobium brasilense]|uniref:FAD binding domain-containing protein n=1 Tax=Bradyrhizobium brasilense TaxID=1419277 RepID=UPI0009F8C9A1|nr:FAD binding domain-containing protein [Bradyrhizobium brasilense]